MKKLNREAGVRVVTGYPGTPSSEIVESLAGVAEKLGLYVEWSLNATRKAMQLGNAIFANIIMLGALSALRLLPFSRKDFADVLTATLPPDKVDINLTAFDSAADLLHSPDGA